MEPVVRPTALSEVDDVRVLPRNHQGEFAFHRLDATDDTLTDSAIEDSKQCA
jgi:hypothetical protein